MSDQTYTKDLLPVIARLNEMMSALEQEFDALAVEITITLPGGVTITARPDDHS